MKRTWRTETSKYPEEKKSTEIPLVVANESGSARSLVFDTLVEWFGKASHRR
jgi:hypothetical protein